MIDLISNSNVIIYLHFAIQVIMLLIVALAECGARLRDVQLPSLLYVMIGGGNETQT